MDVTSIKKSGTGKRLLSIFLALLMACSGLLMSPLQRVSAAGEEILVEPASWGVVTANERNAFKAYMRTRPLPTTNQGNAMVWGTGAGTPGTNSEALAIMYELTGDTEILDLLIQFTDAMLINRNDNNNEKRIMFTGRIEPCWPNAAITSPDAGYAGTENGTVVMHIADCAKLILKHPELWDIPVSVGDPYSYGATYKERALRFIAESDRTMEEFLAPNFIKMVDGVPKMYFPDTDAFQAVKTASPDHRGRYIMWNQQMLLNNGFMALAECHELLGDKPEQVAFYDRIVQASVNAFINDLRPYQKDGHDVYTWDYWPGGTTKVEEAGGAHAPYDIMGLYRAYLRGKYGVPAEVLKKIADTLNYVIWDQAKQMFHFKVDGTDAGNAMRSVLWSEFIPAVEFNLDAYYKVVNSDWLNTAKVGALYAARTFWMEKRLKTLNIARPAKPLTVPEDKLLVNFALGKTYGNSSSWSSTYIADKAFDGNGSTRWSSVKGSTTNQWISVDFGVPTTYNKVVMNEYESRVQSYKLQSSNNGTNYVDIPGTKGTLIGSEKVIYFAPVTSRYLRLYIDSSNKEPSIYELKVYNAPTISPSEAIFDKKAGTPEAVLFRLVPGGRTLNSISNGGYSLVEGKDFTSVAESVYSAVYTINNKYLTSLALGEYALNFDFKTGEDATMKLTVMDTSSTLITSAAPFDKKEGNQADVPAIVNLNGNNLLEISNGNYSLVEGKDYTLGAEGTYYIKKEYLASLPVGVYTLELAFDYGKDLTMNIVVSDTTPPRLVAPQDMTLEATGEWTHVDIGTAASDAGVIVTNNAPSSFPIGKTVVTWTATNKYGITSTAVQTINVVDTTPPVITVAAPVNGLYKTSDSLTVNYIVTDSASGVGSTAATLDGEPVRNGDGINLATKAGSHVLEVTAQDKAGNQIVKKVTFEVVIDAVVSINPQTLNKKSNGGENSITVHIEFPAGYELSEVSVASIKMEVSGKWVEAQASQRKEEDNNNNKARELVVKFDRQKVIEALGDTSGDVNVSITGALQDGRGFVGSDILKVIH